MECRLDADRMVDDVMGSAFGTATKSLKFEPTIDVRAREDEMLFILDVPGVKQDDLDITLEHRLLTIKGVRSFERREGEQVVLGRGYGSFAHTFVLPDNLDESSLRAHLADGVLTLRLPKHAKAKPRKIHIGGGGSDEGGDGGKSLGR